MANVRKLLSQFEESDGEELERLSVEEAEEIEGGKVNISCTENTSCGPNTSCAPKPPATPASA